MKNSIPILLFMVGSFVAGRLSNQISVNAQGRRSEKESAPLCQDVNGDGQVNLTDPVTLLNWLFLGGPEPICPFANGQPLGLPDTGQTVCCDAQGSEIPCDSTTCPRQDGFYQTGCSSIGRFVENQDGTVTDTCTGLMWQRETADTNRDGMINDGDQLNWCDALAYCADLSLADYGDWRLPNIRELQSIADYGRLDPAVDPIFGRVSSVVSWYWSSTSYSHSFASAWGVNFDDGSVLYVDKAGRVYVRAVRSVP